MTKLYNKILPTQPALNFAAKFSDFLITNFKWLNSAVKKNLKICDQKVTKLCSKKCPPDINTMPNREKGEGMLWDLRVIYLSTFVVSDSDVLKNKIDWNFLWRSFILGAPTRKRFATPKCFRTFSSRVFKGNPPKFFFSEKWNKNLLTLKIIKWSVVEKERYMCIHFEKNIFKLTFFNFPKLTTGR